MSLKNHLTFRLLIDNKVFLGLLCIIFLFANCQKEAAKSNTGGDSTGIVNNGNAGQIPLKNMFGVNAYEWNFLGPPDGSVINEANMALVQSFSAVRHYMDWQKLEYTEGNYTFNPTADGGWNYDAIYTRCKQAGILVLADLKNTPPWLVNTYPEALQEVDVVPITYGASKSDPASYLKQAKAAFQFAARYGSNIAIDKNLVTVNISPRWTGDGVNQVKIGLSLVKYIECNNEEDKWWEEIETQQTPEEYAANMSAFYDGNMGKLGNNVGVKTADPNMLVVIGGLASNDPSWITRMIAWCKTNRGYKTDGSVNLCFDVINYHYYANASLNGTADAGVAPELSQAGVIADSFVSLANGMATHPEVWVTESGYDINQSSNQHAIAIGNKSVLITQADWILRSALLYMRHGINQLFFYQLFDDLPGGTTTYQTSGLAVEGVGRRPAADYIIQTTKLMGAYTYVKTISTDPLVDQYQSGSKTMYVLMIPDQKGRTGTYTLTTANNNLLTLYNLKVGADAMTSTHVTPINNKLIINVSETPVFVGN
jgi:hypothetical protein